MEIFNTSRKTKKAGLRQLEHEIPSFATQTHDLVMLHKVTPTELMQGNICFSSTGLKIGIEGKENDTPGQTQVPEGQTCSCRCIQHKTSPPTQALQSSHH